MKRSVLTTAWLAIATGLVACGITPTTVPTTTSIPSSTPTVAPTYTSIPSPTLAATPTHTTTPNATPTATPKLPVQLGTPLPQPAIPISPGNAGQLKQLARWGAGRINAISWSPDGKWIAIATISGTYLFDTRTMEQSAFIESSAEVMSIAFSRNSAWLATGSYKTIKLYSVGGGNSQELRTLSGHTSWVSGVAFSSDGTTLASGSEDNTIKLWDSTNGREIQTLKAHTDKVRGVAFSPDGKLLASGSSDTTVIVWEVATGNILNKFTSQPFIPQGAVSSVAFSPDGKMLAATSLDKSDAYVSRWEMPSGRQLRSVRVQQASGISSVSFSPDSTKLAAGLNGKFQVLIWDAQSGDRVLIIDTQRSGESTYYGDTTPVTFSPDSSMIAAVSVDYRVQVWETASGRELNSLKMEAYRLKSLAFSPDGKLLVVGLRDGTVRVIEVASGRELFALTGHTDEVQSVAFSPNGRVLASAAGDKTIKLWDVMNKRELLTRQMLTGDYPYYSAKTIVFSPDSQKVAATARWVILVAGVPRASVVRMWEVATGQELYTFSGEVASLGFSPDGKPLLATLNSSEVKLLEVPSERELLKLNVQTSQVFGAVFSPDMKRVASLRRDQRVRLWDLTNGREVLTPPRSLAGDIVGVFSPDGSLVAFCPDSTTDYSIQIADAATGQTLVTLGQRDLTRLPDALAFSNDGRLLASGGMDGTIRIWGLAVSRIITPSKVTTKEEAQATLALSSQWRVVLNETFENNVNRWPIGRYRDDFVTGVRLITSGKYSWDVQALQGSSLRSDIDTYPGTDFYLTIVGQQTGGVQDAAYGLIFRRESSNSYYFFGIAEGKQQFTLRLLYNNAWITLIDWTTTSAIRSGDVNRLTVIAEGSHFLLFINGQYVGEASDNNLTIGRVGLTVQLLHTNDQAVIEFDDFEIRAP